MIRRILAVLVLFPILMGQQCLEPLPQSTGTPPTLDPPPRVTLHTNRGDIVIELFPLQAQGATLFKQYVEQGYYDNTVFHAVSKGGTISGGRYRTSLTTKIARPIAADIENNLTNTRGRVALLTPPNATEGIPEFRIHLAATAPTDKGNYTTIGRVVSGLDVADAIAGVDTRSRQSFDGTTLALLPQIPISVNNASLNIADYTDPSDDEQENENGAPSPTDPGTPGENRAPIASAKASSYVFPGVIANLNGANSYDADKDTLTYQWQQTAGPTVTITNPTQARATYPVPDGDGQTLTFRLTVRDPSGAEGTASVTQTVLTEPKVRLTTTEGDLLFTMLPDPAPEGARETVINFLQYVEDGFYDGTIFHRIISSFVVQGGGFLPGLVQPTGLRAPIANQYSDLRSNLRATVAMAKVGDDPDSATSQFFVNLSDNSANLDYQNGGFTVFAYTDEDSMVVLLNMVSRPMMTKYDANGNRFDDIPVTDIILTKAVVEP